MNTATLLVDEHAAAKRRVDAAARELAFAVERHLGRGAFGEPKESELRQALDTFDQRNAELTLLEIYARPPGAGARSNATAPTPSLLARLGALARAATRFGLVAVFIWCCWLAAYAAEGLSW